MGIKLGLHGDVEGSEARVMQNQMDKKMDDEMETGIKQGFIGINVSQN